MTSINTDPRNLETYGSLENIVSLLLSPDGCPWDREQTHRTLKRNLLEECHELMEAIDNHDQENMAEELGDILLQVVFHIQLLEREGKVNTKDVFRNINQKLIRRHPHVFGNSNVNNIKDIKANWEEIKRNERVGSSRLSGIPKELPALAYAQLLQDRASIAGFDWTSITGALEKVEEEFQEFREALNNQAMDSELGDILFSLVNVCRWINVHAEESLRKCNKRFYERFTNMEYVSSQQGIDFNNMSMDDKEALWQEAKKSLEPDLNL